MINFPEWVELPRRQPRAALAEKRLRYIMCRAALERCGNGSVTAFATSIGLDRSTVNLYAKNGKLSIPAAVKAEEVFGKALVRAEWLRNPLSIEME